MPPIEAEPEPWEVDLVVRCDFGPGGPDLLDASSSDDVGESIVEFFDQRVARFGIETEYQIPVHVALGVVHRVERPNLVDRLVEIGGHSEQIQVIGCDQSLLDKGVDEV